MYIFMDKKSTAISKKNSIFAQSIRNIDMKKILLGVISLLFLFSSCKNEVQTALGSYSYKTSVLESSISLPVEVGQLEVISLHAEDSVLLLFNELAGPAYQTKGKIENKKLSFTPFTRVINIGLRDYQTTISGSAEMYDNTLIFDYEYKGENTDTLHIILGDTILVIDDSVRVFNAHVQSIAKKNNQ